MFHSLSFARLWYCLPAVIFSLSAGAQPAAEPIPPQAAAAAYLAGHPIRGVPADLAPSQAAAWARAFVSALDGHLGGRVGYKVALTNPVAQRFFQAQEPIWGVLFDEMLYDDGDVIPVSAGAQLMFEPDLLVLVGSEEINGARTPLEAARHLVRVIAFLEVPDLMLDSDEPLNASVLTALNAGARFGVLGDTVNVTPSRGFVDALARMTVTVSDQTGVLGISRGSEIMGNPLNALLWLIDELKDQGRALRRGDLVSLGSFMQPMEAAPGQLVTVEYDGLPGGTLSVSVQFARE